VNLDAEHRQAIETRLDHNAAGTEPAKNPALVDELATQMTQTPHEFARRDLIPAIAHLPLPQWQRFRDWQAGTRRNDPATEDELYAIKRGLRLATKMLPTNTAEDRAELLEEIHTWRRINGRSPSDTEIISALDRHLMRAPFVPNIPKVDPYHRVVGPNVNPPWPSGLEFLFARGGHHFIPQAVYKRLGLPQDALKVFRDATSGPLMPKDHQNDQAHRRYSDAVAKEIDRWLERKGIDPRKMTETQARELLKHVLNSKNPVIREYMRMIGTSRSRYIQRYGSRGID